ncbi:hypothetical protein CEXT_538021 [Caerostris extrusa]|uniref:Uncharacterized protein n=1 Tax=Caerostris extrusa TaxID=172846 RepID=A0AAV4XKG8_CAEEX|nr:hypothetical protein CEXT_538021 [Caerostris extrusa]
MAIIERARTCGIGLGISGLIHNVLGQLSSRGTRVDTAFSTHRVQHPVIYLSVGPRQSISSPEATLIVFDIH